MCCFFYKIIYNKMKNMKNKWRNLCWREVVEYCCISVLYPENLALELLEKRHIVLWIFRRNETKLLANTAFDNNRLWRFSLSVFSAIAGNINFIDFDMLREEKLLLEEEYQTLFMEMRKKSKLFRCIWKQKISLGKSGPKFSKE